MKTKESILDKIGYYEFDRNRSHIFGIKSAIVWGHEFGRSFPLLYISKPKSVSQEDFEAMLERLEITFK